MRILIVVLSSAFFASNTFAADFIICERANGAVHISDRASTVPDDCTSRETRALEAPSPSKAPGDDVGADAQRWAAIDDLVARAKVRRADESAAREEWIREARDTSRALIQARMALQETHDRLASERWRWTAYMPGQWIILFADERQIARLEKRESVLKRDVLELIDVLLGLKARARAVRVPYAVVEETIPDLSVPRPAPEPDYESWGYPPGYPKGYPPE